MSSIGIILIAAAALSPVVIAGAACNEIVENKHMQEIAHRNTARRQNRWAHL